MCEVEVLGEERGLEEHEAEFIFGRLQDPVSFGAPNQAQPLEPSSSFVIRTTCLFEALVVIGGDDLID